MSTCYCRTLVSPLALLGGSHLTSEMKERCAVTPIGYQVLMFLVGLASMGTLALWA